MKIALFNLVGGLLSVIILTGTACDNTEQETSGGATLAASLEIETFMNYFYHEINLPRSISNGSSISWTSDSDDYPIKNDKVTVRDNVDGNFKFKLNATITKGSEQVQKDFEITAQEKNYYGYLFAYFNGNAVSEEQVRYALSMDGLNFIALNNDQAVISSSKIAATGGVRDPYIMRGVDGKFYMTVTDMTSSKGWASNRGIVLLKSGDLINWTYGQVNISTKYPDKFGDINSAWAPEIIYDRKAQKYLIHFSSYKNDVPHRIFYSYANDDFTDLTDTPRQLFEHPEDSNAIDNNIVYLNGKYHLFYKNEGNGNHIAKAASRSINTGYILTSINCDNESVAVEGCEAFRLIGKDTFVLMYDKYNNNQFGFRTSTDLDDWTTVSGSTKKADGASFVPRHGSVIPLTQEEYELLESHVWTGA